MIGTSRHALRAATLAAVLLAGCAADTTPRTIPDSTMVHVLVDLHLVGARERLGGDVPSGLRDSVLARYGLDSAAFREGMAWYETHPDEFVAIYGTVVDQLNAERNP